MLSSLDKNAALPSKRSLGHGAPRLYVIEEVGKPGVSVIAEVRKILGRKAVKSRSAVFSINARRFKVGPRNVVKLVGWRGVYVVGVTSHKVRDKSVGIASVAVVD